MKSTSKSYRTVQKPDLQNTLTNERQWRVLDLVKGPRP